MDLGLRLAGQQQGGRLQPSNIHESMPLQISLTTPDDIDSEVLRWLQQATIRIAEISYQRPLGLTQQEPDRRFLARRLGELLD